MQRSMSQVMDTDYGVETGTLAKARLIEEVAERLTLIYEWRASCQSLFEQLMYCRDNSNSTNAVKRLEWYQVPQKSRTSDVIKKRRIKKS